MNISRNSVVSLTYELFDADGKSIEKADAPMEYLHGHAGIFPLVEKALEGKAVGDTCRVRLAPGDAFGEYDAQLVRMEARDKFPAKVEVGMQFEGQGSQSGHTVIYTVTDIADGKVVVDGNHPMAGMALRFSCTVESVRKASKEELEHGHVHGPHGHEH